MPSGTSRLPSRIGFVKRVGRRFETASIGIEVGERAPERLGGAAMQFAGNRLEQTELCKHAERLLGGAGAQDLVVLLEQPWRRALRDLVPMRPDGIEHWRIDREVQTRGEGDGAQHADRIFAQPDIRVADRSDDAGAQILESADVIDDRERRDVVDERVDGEVAPERVLLGSAEGVVVMDQVLAFGRGGIGRGDAVLHDLFARRHLTAEGGDLDDLRAELDVREPEAPADDPAVAKELLDLVRMRRCPDVEILWAAADEQVANAAADEIGDVVELPQPIENLERVGIDVAPRDRVLCARDDPRLGHRWALYQKRKQRQLRPLCTNEIAPYIRCATIRQDGSCR